MKFEKRLTWFLCLFIIFISSSEFRQFVVSFSFIIIFSKDHLFEFVTTKNIIRQVLNFLIVKNCSKAIHSAETSLFLSSWDFYQFPSRNTVFHSSLCKYFQLKNNYLTNLFTCDILFFLVIIAIFSFSSSSWIHTFWNGFYTFPNLLSETVSNVLLAKFWCLLSLTEIVFLDFFSRTVLLYDTSFLVPLLISFFSWF